jgi:NAD(P)-dependent dehydrogenase (short-subunit alcohol dehydrogenase family)
MVNYAVIGAGGAIGSEAVRQLAQQHPRATVYAVSRKQLRFNDGNVKSVQLATGNESEVARWLLECKECHIRFKFMLCAIGQLHDDLVQPEKRLEQVTAQGLQHYFAVNTVTPFLWLKSAINHLDADASFVVLSAKVGSISDNALGGWYGYRASKAALNMLVKTASVEYARRKPGVLLVCYHPGTVDTPLSAPFQANVPLGKLFTVEFTVTQLLNHMMDLNPQHNPHYIDWQGQHLPW